MSMIRAYPIRVIVKSRKSWFKTMSAKPQADTSEKESAIGEMVASRELYGLTYGLTEEEVGIKEG